MSTERIVVMIEDGTKKAEDYAPARRVKVELHYNVAENEAPEDVLQYVSDLAQSQVAKLLSQKPGAVVRPTLADADAAATVQRRGPGRPAKAANEETVKQPGVKVGDEGVAAVRKDEVPLGPVERESDLDDLIDEKPAEKPISDAELQNAMGRAKAATNNTPVLRELILSRKPKDWPEDQAWRVVCVKPEDRKAFLAELAKVPKLDEAL